MPEIIGQMINNRYRVDTFIGRGGMAEVFKVWDNQRSVPIAMKVLHEDLAEDIVFLRRFKREAHTLARLQHPNIVRFYGLEEANGLAYILMDFVDGITLRKEIARMRAPFPSESVLEIMQPVCAALHYAHMQGFVHCDVKPANIMIDENGKVLLSDFGIARMSESATTATMVGVGTPAYMAPEQVRGQDPTPQTDIYALGIVLYEMVTGGERPFTGERASITGSTGEKVRWEQVNTQPISPRRYNPGLPKEMEAITLCCLGKKPAERFKSTVDLLTAVEQAFGITQSRGVTGRPEPVELFSDGKIESGSSLSVKGGDMADASGKQSTSPRFYPDVKETTPIRKPVTGIVLTIILVIFCVGILMFGFIATRWFGSPSDKDEKTYRVQITDTSPPDNETRNAQVEVTQLIVIKTVAAGYLQTVAANLTESQMLTLTVVPIATQIRTAVYETIASPLQEVVTTKSVPLPSATPYITLNGPKDGSSFETKGQVEFSWNAFPGAADYRLDIIPSSKNAVKGVSVTTKELSKTQFIENYPWGGLFTWQVIALNAQGIPIGFSEKESFTKPILSGDLICIEQGPFIYWKDDGSVDCLKWECDGYKRGKDCYSE